MKKENKNKAVIIGIIAIIVVIIAIVMISIGINKNGENSQNEPRNIVGEIKNQH